MWSESTDQGKRATFISQHSNFCKYLTNNSFLTYENKILLNMRKWFCTASLNPSFCRDAFNWSPHTDAQLVTMIALMNNQISPGIVLKDNAIMSSIQHITQISWTSRFHERSLPPFCSTSYSKMLAIIIFFWCYWQIAGLLHTNLTRDWADNTVNGIRRTFFLLAKYALIQLSLIQPLDLSTLLNPFKRPHVGHFQHSSWIEWFKISIGNIEINTKGWNTPKHSLYE